MTHILTTLPLAILIASCGTDDTADTATAEGCQITASADYPVAGQADAYYRANIEFGLSDVDPSATISLTSATGEVAGTVTMNEDGDEVIFTPDSSLDPSASYTATLTWCDGENTAEIAFSTSSLGTPLDADIEGSTYVLDIADGRFIKPAGVGEIIGGLLANKILIGIKSADDGDLAIRGAISMENGDDQDLCAQTLEEFPTADFNASPYFELPEGDVALSVAGYDVSIMAMSIAGTFSSDGSYFGGGTMSGELDARTLAPLLADQLEIPEDEDPGQYMCDLLIGFGVACIPCSSDGDPFCAILEIDQLVADNSGVEIKEILQTDCDEECAASCDNKECVDADDFAICE